MRWGGRAQAAGDAWGTVVPAGAGGCVDYVLKVLLRDDTGVRGSSCGPEAHGLSTC